jgi:hypothetical protein
MGIYKVKLMRRTGEGKEVTYLYVKAPDTQGGYQKAADKAEAKLEKEKRLGFHAVDVMAVG